MSAARRLVINADDFGLSAGVTRGIVEGHEAGVVTSTSLLVNAPAFADAVAAARRLPRLGVGIHFNLTTGRPVSPPAQVPSLCDRAGRFHSLASLAARALTGRIAASEVGAECRAQLARFAATGLRPTHLDGHHHVHLLPGIWAPVAAAARAAGVWVVRVPLEAPGRIAWRPSAALAQVLLAASYRLADHTGELLTHADHFRGFALTGQPDFEARLLEVLDRLEPGVTELMVHPGYPDPGLAEWVAYTHGREAELTALTSDAVRARLARGDIALVHFGAL
jgi:hopanoid biosynthesis associated protein HpnK